MNTKPARIVSFIVALGCVALVARADSVRDDPPSPGYSIPIVDLAGETSRQTVVDREPGQYLGHPTTVLLEDGRTMLAVYPKGHGRGPIVMKRSDDGGRTWSERLPVPESWATSQEVPTLYRVIDPRDGANRLIMFTGLHPIRMSVSEDDGATWSPLAPIGDFGGIVAMSTIGRLDDGSVLAMFHDDGRFFREGGSATETFTLYQTRSRDGGLTWSEPEAIYADDDVHLCEPGLIRSPDGGRLAILLRENSRRRNAFVMFSDDEGSTWSAPRELPGALTGDRHVGRYAPDGRLFVSFRDTTRESPTKGDWVGWVGTWDDIVDGGEGQYRVRLMDNHHRADCGYPAVEVLSDGTFVCTSYGHWREGESPYVVSVRFTMDELDARAGGASTPSTPRAISDMVDVECMARMLGNDWKRNQSLMVESVERLDELSPETRAIAAAVIERYRAIGVVGFGEVSFSKVTAPLNTLNVRIFRFGTPAQAEEWRSRSYDGERGRSQYARSRQDGRVVYDSLQRKKRVVFNDDLWITSSHIGDGDLHVDALERCVVVEGGRSSR